MAYHYERERSVPEQIFQPEDAFEIKVVGRLVEQQEVRLPHQLPGDRAKRLRPTRRRACRRGWSAESAMPAHGEANVDARRLLVFLGDVVRQRVGHRFQHGAFAVEHVLLRQVAEPHRALAMQSPGP